MARDVDKTGSHGLISRLFSRGTAAPAKKSAPEVPPSLYLTDSDRLAIEAFHEAAWYIGEHGIDGDIVDCGIGETTDLKIIALALLSLGERSRRLILFDTSMIPAHRAEKVMPLWGSWGEALFRANNNGLKAPPSLQDLIPTALVRTGYPVTNIRSVTQFTPRAINTNLSPQISWLLMTCDTHRANPLVLSQLLQRLADGAVVVVRGYAADPAIESREPVRMLRACAPGLELAQLSGSYWIGKTLRRW